MTEADPARWLTAFGPADHAKPQVICFPHAGGAASYFHPLARALSGRAEVRGVQYPGRQARHREPLMTAIGDLADGVSAALAASVDPLRRPVFIGHSMGALIAFETTRRLERDGVTVPIALVPSAGRAPSVSRGELWHTLRDDELLTQLVEQGGIDKQVLQHPELVEMMLRVSRADLEAVDQYDAGDDAVITAPIVALSGDRDPRTTPTEVDAWRNHTTGAFRAQEFPGGHFYLDRHVDAIAELLLDIAAAPDGPAGPR